jgi:hypothetical protein
MRSEEKRAGFYRKSEGGKEALAQTMTLECHLHPQSLNLFLKSLTFKC